VKVLTKGTATAHAFRRACTARDSDPGASSRVGYGFTHEKLRANSHVSNNLEFQPTTGGLP
jgi:hypothetical protein